jgi:hypothetical protein
MRREEDDMTEQFPVPPQQGMYKPGQPTVPSATGAHDDNMVVDSFDGLSPTSLASGAMSKYGQLPGRTHSKIAMSINSPVI